MKNIAIKNDNVDKKPLTLSLNIQEIVKLIINFLKMFIRKILEKNLEGLPTL